MILGYTFSLPLPFGFFLPIKSAKVADWVPNPLNSSFVLLGAVYELIVMDCILACYCEVLIQ